MVSSSGQLKEKLCAHSGPQKAHEYSLIIPSSQLLPSLWRNSRKTCKCRMGTYIKLITRNSVMSSKQSPLNYTKGQS